MTIRHHVITADRLMA